MKITIVVITCNNDLFKHLRVKSDAAIPQDIRRVKFFAEHGVEFRMLSYLNAGGDGLTSLTRNVRRITSQSDGVVVISDESAFDQIIQLYRSFFTFKISSALDGKNPNNYMGMILAYVLRIFAAYSMRFKDEKYKKLFLLPLDNFDAPEVREMSQIFLNLAAVQRFPDALDRIIALLINRQRPKVTSNYSNRHIVDDKDFHFSYGHERHALPDSEVPPHNLACLLNAEYRFGLLYDRERHYNVSLDHPTDRITGQFVGCHGEVVASGSRKHINMFPNNFVA